MTARILYHETREFDPGLHEYESNQFVRVELRQWKDGAHHDTIIDKRVVVDGEEVVRETKVLAGGSDAWSIRYAIEVFDALVACHPWANGAPPTRETEEVPA